MPEYIWPVPKGTGISQPFGSSPGGFNPAGGHTGTDFLTPMWTPIRAIADGVVGQAGWLSGTYLDNPWWLEPSFAGIVVAIDHGPLVSIYAHLIETKLNPGDRVKQGDIIGYSGNTRNKSEVFGPHLHFETIPDGWSFSDGTYGRRDPARYCAGYWSGTATQGDKPSLISPSTEEGFFMALSDKEQRELLALARQIAKYADTKISAVAGKVWSTPVVGRAGGPVSALQELADVKTKVLGLEPVITSIAEQTDPARIAEMIPTDIAAQVMAALSAKLAEGAK